MSSYTPAINALFAGETVLLPQTTNITSLRRQFNRIGRQLREDNIVLSPKVLRIEEIPEGYRAHLEKKPTVQFAIVEVQDDQKT